MNVRGNKTVKKKKESHLSKKGKGEPLISPFCHFHLLHFMRFACHFFSFSWTLKTILTGFS